MGDNIGYEFIEKTKYPYTSQSDQDKGFPQPPLAITFPGVGDAIELPPPPETPLKQIIDTRASTRAYRSAPISQEELSFLLWCTQGIKSYTETRTRRTVPSAGARHALETFLLVNRVRGIAPGIYHYVAFQHALQARVISNTIADDVVAVCLQQEFIRESAVTFFWVAILERMVWRYTERGFRYLFLDAGHVCQNLYLSAESIGCGACAIGAFDDDRLNDLLGVDGKQKFVVYMAAVGKKQ